MEKVSKKIDGGISSAYFDLDYLPSTDRSNTNLNSKCAALIIDMAIADATREEKHIMTLMATFSEALCMCKTQEEIDNFSIFMGKLAAIGGLAKGFSYSMKDMMNEEGKIEAQKIIDYRNNQIKEKKGQRQNNSNELRNFEQSYANLNNEYQKFKKEPMINDRNLTLLLEMYQNLRNYLFRIKGTINSDLFTKYDEQISSVINNLNSISQSIGDIGKPIERK